MPGVRIGAAAEASLANINLVVRRALFAALLVESRCFRMRTQSILLALAAAALVPSALAT